MKKNRKGTIKTDLFPQNNLLGGSQSKGGSLGPQAGNPFGLNQNAAKPFPDPASMKHSPRPGGTKGSKNTSPGRMRKTGP